MRSTGKAESQDMPGGFTLLEILIAIFIFALVVSAIFAAYRGTFSMIDTTESQEDIYQMARIALNRIAEDLESACSLEPPEGSETEEAISESVLFKGEQKEINDRRCVGLRFLSLAHLTFSDEKSLAEPAEIAYYAAAGNNEEVLDLYRSDTLQTNEKPESGTAGVLLCKGLSSIDVIYYDAEGEPHENWDTDEGASKGKLPSRVSIRMEFPNQTDPSRPIRFMTGVAIPMGGEPL